MNRCFVLGAGFSKPFGLPLASDLVAEAFKRFESGASKYDGSPISQQADFWKKNLARLYPGCDCITRYPPDLEDLVTMLEEWAIATRLGHTNWEKKDYRNPEHFKNRLLRHIKELLVEKLPPPNSSHFRPVYEFVRHVVAKGEPVISFNWDVLLEAAAFDLGVNVSYDENDCPEMLRLIKPHGSVNLATIAGGTLDRPKPMLLSRLKRFPKLPSGEEVVQAIDPRDTTDCMAPFEESLLVAPSPRKQYLSHWLDEQWRNAYGLVRLVKEIVVLGYSMPPTDHRARALFQMSVLHGDPSPRIVLVAPNAEEVVKERFHCCVGVPVEPVNGSWVDWFAKHKEE